MGNSILGIIKDIFLVILTIISVLIINIIGFKGISLNLVFAAVALTILLFLQFSKKKEKIIFFYSKRLHSLIETKYNFLIKGHVFLKLFLIIFALANVLCVLLVL